VIKFVTIAVQYDYIFYNIDMLLKYKG